MSGKRTEMRCPAMKMPADMMPAPTELTDITEVNKTFQFDSDGHET